MIYKVYALFDTVSGEYSQPSIEVSDAMFRRSIENALSNKNSLLYTHSADFIGRCLGTYDSESGKLDACAPDTVFNVFSLRGDENAEV